jgi:hypothetical protein
MLIPFGVLSAAAFAPVAEGDYELIASEILTTNEASITFSNLGDYSSTYKHLQIRTVGRTDRGSGAVADTALVRINGDTGSNYSRHFLLGDGSSVSSGAGASQTSMFGPRFTAAGATANAFGAGVIDILDPYSTTKNTTIRSLNGIDILIYLTSGAFLSTAAVSSVTLLPEIGSNFVSGSRFSLYGIKG